MLSQHNTTQQNKVPKYSFDQNKSGWDKKLGSPANNTTRRHGNKLLSSGKIQQLYYHAILCLLPHHQQQPQ